MAWNKLTTSPLKGRRRKVCSHEQLRKPQVIDGDIYQRCARCEEFILVSRKEIKLVSVINEHLSILNMCG